SQCTPNITPRVRAEYGWLTMFFFSSIRRHTRFSRDWSSDVCSSDLRWNIAALDFIFTTPVFRNNKFTSNAGIPAPTAAKISRMMVEKGLLETLEESSGRRPALYAFEPLLKLVRV